MEIHTIVSAPFEENSYIIWLPGRHDAVVIDPGLEPELILHFLSDNELTLTAILNTHGHADHIGGNGVLKKAFPGAPLIIGEKETALLSDAFANLSAPFGFSILSPPADRTVREGDVVEAAGLCFEVLDIPGHSPGHVAYVCRGEPILVFGGDVLFRQSIGRTDFPGSSHDLLVGGIRSKLFTLPPDTVVYPGHGPTTTIRNESASNPFV
jgi:hydroxyacylglutathione hydrolase